MEGKTNWFGLVFGWDLLEGFHFFGEVFQLLSEFGLLMFFLALVEFLCNVV